jgi:hypothetical protein
LRAGEKEGVCGLRRSTESLRENGMSFVSKEQTAVSLSAFNNCSKVKVTRES